ncbi:hypothetical protein [Phaeobacter sp. BS52]
MKPIVIGLGVGAVALGGYFYVSSMETSELGAGNRYRDARS